MRGSVRVGVYIGNQRPKGTDMRDALAEQIREVRSVRDQGWDSIWTGQHFLTDSSSQLSTIVTLTRLAHEAGDMHIGIGLLLPLLNPVEVAENAASLDVVTGGRLILGLGIGYRQVEYDAFGVPKTESARRFAANVRIVDELLQGKTVDADYPWCTLNGASISVAPVQSPRLPLWIGANSDAGVRRAARMADAPHMPHGGRVMAVSGWDSFRVLPGHGLLGAAKAAMEAIVRYLAIELGPKGITAVGICPGPIDTDSFRYYAGDQWDLYEKNWLSLAPSRKFPTPDEIADVMVFFCSPASAAVNGQTIVVDGGLSLATMPAP
jgi:NAD(P)-dependent dehydrogenase (short-subunit alcohol dehydrogenase family)